MTLEVHFCTDSYYRTMTGPMKLKSMVRMTGIEHMTTARQAAGSVALANMKSRIVEKLLRKYTWVTVSFIAMVIVFPMLVMNRAVSETGTDIKAETVREESRVPDQSKVQTTEDPDDGTLNYWLSSIMERIHQERGTMQRLLRDMNIGRNHTLTSAVRNVGNITRLEEVLTNVVQTRRTMRIGVVGGSISAGGGISCKECVFSYILGESLQRVLGSPVETHNAAVGATDSRYYTYCLETHLDARDMDLILWELSANDYNKGLPPSAQEELTRAILELPNQPQLVYANFIFGKQMRQRTCINSEDNGGHELSVYYDVPSLSLKGVLCHRIMKGQTDELVANDENHPSSTVHTLMAMVLKSFIMDSLEKVIMRLMDNGNVSQHFSEIDRTQIPDDMPTAKAGRILHRPLFNDTFISHAQCWSSLLPQFGTGTYLMPTASQGWRSVALTGAVNMNRTDSKKCWITSKQGMVIVFPLYIKPYRNLSCTVALTTLTCDDCGAVKVHMDNEVNQTVIVDSKYTAKVTHTHNVAMMSPQEDTTSRWRQSTANFSNWLQ
ncbi:uncharacterized protein [Ptychodera flava]|uniref:uncharacterized protein n=1 Tax=Ptychodera flava TaxID=63121 RepID=UPI003969C535